MLIQLYVRDEVQYDRFHENVDRIVRVTSHYGDDNETRSFARSNPAVGPTLLQEIAEVEQTVRFQRYSAPLQYGDRVFNENDLYFAGASIESRSQNPETGGIVQPLFIGEALILPQDWQRARLQ